MSWNEQINNYNIARAQWEKDVDIALFCLLEEEIEEDERLPKRRPAKPMFTERTTEGRSKVSF